MYLFKGIRPVLAVLALITFSAICATAQAEIDPDHFSDPPVLQTSVEKTQHPAPAPHSQHATRQIKAQNNARTAAHEHGAHGRSAPDRSAVSSNSFDHSAAEKRYKKGILEARRHGAS
ncbi:MAG TPA: hypothetical protein VFY05_00765 [Candidatus Angelobacter sp.]|nr:hypothetical protein [Candidatus Angelobacter sp.]